MKKLIYAVLLISIFGRLSAIESSSPNVILILIDDMGMMDSSTYGSKYYQTPNMTRLAKKGMLFTDGYAASPSCSPTRASIMSGQHPSRLRITQAITPKEVPVPEVLSAAPHQYSSDVQAKNHMPLGIVTLAEMLKKKNYHTAHIGKWHLTPVFKGWKTGDPTYDAEHQGFDFVIGGQFLPGPPDYYSPYKGRIRNLKPGPDGEYLNERLANESIQWIDSVKDSGRPFFLNFWHYAIHGPVIAKKDLLPKYRELRDPNAGQRSPEFATMIESMDNSLGMLMDWMELPENKDLLENTVVIFTSDNGGVNHRKEGDNPWTSNRPLRGGKAHIYEGGVRVPFIVSWPGVIEGGSVSSMPVQSTDIYPTVLSIAGITPEPNQVIDGQDINPLLRGKEMEHQPIFTDYPHYIPATLNVPASSVRVGDWKLIRFYNAGVNAELDAYELYDLSKDPYESVDLSKYFAQKVGYLNGLIEKHLLETQALMPVPNKGFKGDPMLTPKPKSIAPVNLLLETTFLSVKESGSRRLQLKDENGETYLTHAVVIEGEEWVAVDSLSDGSIQVNWKSGSKPGKALIAFGWKGGHTASEVNDWSIPTQELLIVKE